jgi:hypothetical protein
MFPVYGGKCFPCEAVHEWVKTFSQGRSKVTNDARPGHPVEIATEATVQQVEELIQAERRITIDMVATTLGCSHGLAYIIMHDHLKSRPTGKRGPLHHDNARAHRAQATQERVQELQWELPEHLPYSQNLAPSDFHLFGLFGPLKKCLG